MAQTLLKEIPEQVYPLHTSSPKKTERDDLNSKDSIDLREESNIVGGNEGGEMEVMGDVDGSSDMKEKNDTGGSEKQIRRNDGELTFSTNFNDTCNPAQYPPMATYPYFHSYGSMGFPQPPKRPRSLEDDNVSDVASFSSHISDPGIMVSVQVHVHNMGS